MRLGLEAKLAAGGEIHRVVHLMGRQRQRAAVIGLGIARLHHNADTVARPVGDDPAGVQLPRVAKVQGGEAPGPKRGASR